MQDATFCPCLPSRFKPDKMKNFIAVFAFIALSFVSVAQDTLTQNIDIHASITSAIPVYMRLMEGAASYNFKDGFVAGLGYRLAKGRNAFITGLDYARYRFNSSWIDGTGHEQHSTEPIVVSLITIPLNYGVDITKSFSFGFGPFIGLETNADDGYLDRQSGVGLNIFFQKRFNIGRQLMIGLSPELRMHSVLPIPGDRNQRRLIEAKLGLSLHRKLSSIVR